MAALTLRVLTNPGDTTKGSALTNSEMDQNLIDLNNELDLKAPIASPTFTGTTTIPTVDINAGAIDGTSIGATTRSTGAFTTLAANGAVTMTAGTASTTTGTGTLVITGGLGVSGQVTAATGSFTSVNIDGGTIDGTSVGATTRSTGAFTTLAANGAVTMTAGTASTSDTTGTLVVTGGAGISGRVSANDARLDGAIASTTTTTGTLVVTGGVGISGQVTAATGAFAALNMTGLASFKTMQQETYTANVTGATNLDLSLYDVFVLTLTGNTTITFTNPPTTGIFKNVLIVVRQDATGSRTLSVTNGKYTDGVAPVLTTTANAIDILTYFTYNGGTTYVGSFVGADIK